MMRSTIIVVAALMTIFRLIGYFTEPRLEAADIHRIVGVPEGIAREPASGGPIRVVSWNIERGVNFDRIADQLRAMDADVILLQEVDRFCARSGTRDVARELAERLHMNWIAAGEYQEIGEGNGRVAALTGQAVLSRDAIVDASVTVFDAQVRLRWRLNPVQPRRGGRIALRARTAGALVYDLHVESGGDDALRQRQVDEVLADAARQGDERIVIAGDFNTSHGAGPALAASFAAPRFADALGASTVNRQTQINYRHPIDWIFARGLTASGGRVERVENVSDHYPLVATLTAQD